MHLEHVACLFFHRARITFFLRGKCLNLLFKCLCKKIKFSDRNKHFHFREFLFFHRARITFFLCGKCLNLLFKCLCKKIKFSDRNKHFHFREFLFFHRARITFFLCGKCLNLLFKCLCKKIKFSYRINKHFHFREFLFFHRARNNMFCFLGRRCLITAFDLFWDFRENWRIFVRTRYYFFASFYYFIVQEITFFVFFEVMSHKCFNCFLSRLQRELAKIISSCELLIFSRARNNIFILFE